MRTIEVKSCAECPFMIEDESWGSCGISKKVSWIDLPDEKVHKNCPLKKESVTVKLKEE